MSRAQLAAIKKLLLSRNADQIVQGAELAGGLGDQDLWDRLLDGVGWEKDGVRPKLASGENPNPTIGRLIPPSIFPRNMNSLLWDEMATAFLLAASTHPLRDEVTHLSLAAITTDPSWSTRVTVPRS